MKSAIGHKLEGKKICTNEDFINYLSEIHGKVYALGALRESSISKLML